MYSVLCLIHLYDSKCFCYGVMEIYQNKSHDATTAVTLNSSGEIIRFFFYNLQKIMYSNYFQLF